MNITFDTCAMSRNDALGIVSLLSTVFQFPMPALFTGQANLPSAPSDAPAPETVASGPMLVVQPEPAQPIQGAPEAPSEAQPEATQPAKRHRRTKAEIAADEAAAKVEAAPAGSVPVTEASASEPAPTEAQPAAESTQKSLTADELRNLLNGYIARHSMEEAIKQLQKFNCNRVSEALTLEPAKLAELAAVLRG